MPASLFSTSRSGARHPWPRVALLGAALLALATACSEQLETTAVCPDLCPQQNIEVQQVELQPVVLDSTLAGFPLLGNEPYLAMVRRGDTLETRAAVRFDELPQHYRLGPASLDSARITAVLEPRLQLVLDRRVSDLEGPVTIEAYDITHAGPDTSTAAVLPLFTAARRLGQVIVPQQPSTDTARFDTLHVSIDPARLLTKIDAEERLRVGLRITGTDRASVLLTHGVTLNFRAAADTAVPEVVVLPRSQTPGDDSGLRSDFRSYVIVVAGTAPPPPTAISVGGLPGRRSYLRFELPAAILDSSTVVRATLVLTQRPVRGFVADDSLTVLVFPVTASDLVTDIDRLTRLAANPMDGRGNEFQVVAPLVLAPGDSGEVEMQVANIVSLWSQRSGAGLQRALVLSSSLEGGSPLGVNFFSSEAPPELRPTLRLSYIRRVNFNLP